MSDRKSRKKRILKAETVRERAEKTTLTASKSRRIRQTATGITKPFKIIPRGGRRAFYLLTLNNKVGRFLKKHGFFIPRYFRNSWKELRQVVWPKRKETWKLTLAVFLFSIIFGFLISVVDFGLDKLFRKVILKI